MMSSHALTNTTVNAKNAVRIAMKITSCIKAPLSISSPGDHAPDRAL
jgi:hypothetical protein